MALCNNCGEELNGKQVVCLKCGCAACAYSTHNKWIAAILAFLLGGLGVHKFYLGQKGWGIVYILFCWTGIPSIVAFIEMILYLLMSDEEFAAKYH